MVTLKHACILECLHMLPLHDDAFDDVAWCRTKYCHILSRIWRLRNKKTHFLKVTNYCKCNYSIKRLLHWYPWLLSLLEISMDIHKRVSFSNSKCLKNTIRKIKWPEMTPYLAKALAMASQALPMPSLSSWARQIDRKSFKCWRLHINLSQ